MNKKLVVAHIVASLLLVVPVVVLAHGAVEDGHIEEAVVVSDGHTDHVHDAVPAAPVDGVENFVGDGHTDHAHSAGGSELLVAFSPAWWGLLGVSALLTALLSFGVWKFLSVAPVKKPDAKSVAQSVEVKK